MGRRSARQAPDAPTAPSSVRVLFVAAALSAPEAELLSKMIEAMGLQPGQFAIDDPAEAGVLSAEVVVALGAEAAQAVLGDPAAAPRGRFVEFQGEKLLATAHPSELLKDPGAKRAAWADLQLVVRELGLAGPPGSKKKG